MLLYGHKVISIRYMITINSIWSIYVRVEKKRFLTLVIMGVNMIANAKKSRLPVLE